jgi:hypothetical protein
VPSGMIRTVAGDGAAGQSMSCLTTPSWTMSCEVPPHHVCVMTAHVGGTDTWASPKATGTHEAGVVERSMAGCGMVVSGNVTSSQTDVPTTADAARVSVRTTAKRARNLTVVMLPRSPQSTGSRMSCT